MKKILLLSDTHSYIDERILKYVAQADEVWHAGDIGDLAVADAIRKIKPLRAVYGNIDGQELRSEFPEDLFFYCEKVAVFMTHIGGYPGKYVARVKQKIEALRPKIYICGHSHILKVQYDPKLAVLHLNPGAAGIYGMHQVSTMLRFVIEGPEIKDMEVIEFAKNKKMEL